MSTNTTILRSNVTARSPLRLPGRPGSKIAFNAIIRSGKGKGTEGIAYEELASTMTELKELAEERRSNSSGTPRPLTVSSTPSTSAWASNSAPPAP